MKSKNMNSFNSERKLKSSNLKINNSKKSIKEKLMKILKQLKNKLSISKNYSKLMGI